MPVQYMAPWTTKRQVISIITEVIKNYLPQYEPSSFDHQLAIIISNDLEEWFERKLLVEHSKDNQGYIEKILKKNSVEFKAFLNYWIGLWLEKWRERVRFVSKKPSSSSHLVRVFKEAKRVYEKMEHKKELRELVIWRLISKGEICLSGLIADHLIIKEIAKRVQNVNENMKLMKVYPYEIFTSLYQYISNLTRERGPLIYLDFSVCTL